MSEYAGNIVTTGADAGYSVAFDGTGDYLNSTITALGSGSFTIECWAYFSAAVASKGVFHAATAAPLNSTVTGIAVANGASGGWNLYYNNGSQNTNTSLTPNLNTWNHIAVVKSGTTVYLYINGILNQSQTDTANYTNQSAVVGGFFSTSNLMTGYVSGFRVVIGSALYSGTSTTAANFNLPTQLLNVSGTAFLTCNSPAIIDQSSNAFTITPNGDAKVSTFSPFAGYRAYNPALGAATPGVWKLSEATQAMATRRWNMYDPYFNLTTLKLGGNQPGGVTDTNNNVFKDSSSNNFTITRNGNTTQGTFTPFSQTGWSNYFNGSSWITAPAGAAFNFGTGDFTGECFVNISSFAAATRVMGQTSSTSTAASTSFLIDISTAGVVSAYISNGSAFLQTSGNTISITTNSWNHIAVARDGATFRLYVNGVQSGTVSVSGVTVPSSTEPFTIGRNGTNSGSYVNGYISNVRIVKGTCLYPSGASFAVSTSPLTAITNTSLLTCQSNRFIDNSASPLTLTVNGAPSVQAFSPFLTNVAYTPTLQGGSGYFDGTGDYLTAPASSVWNLNTTPWTLEFWLYQTASGGTYTFWGQRPNTGTYAPLNITVISSNLIQLYGSTNNAAWNINFTGTKTVTPNAWNHIVVQHNGTNFVTYVNGALDINSASSPPYSTTVAQAIGAGTTDGVNPVVGYVGSTRLIKGQALYSGTGIAVPNAPFTTTGYGATNQSITGSVGLLMNFTNAGIVDSTGKVVFETVGNAQISTAQSKYGGSSMYFDGAGDLLQGPSSPYWTFGSNDFSIEFWFYTPSATTRGHFVTNRNTAGTSWELFINTNSKIYFGNVTTDFLISTNTVSSNTWYHVAVTRQGANLKMFINGSQEASVTNSTNFSEVNTLQVGALNSTTYPFNGYMQDLRITKGYARYTSNFTPPTSLLQNQ